MYLSENEHYRRCAVVRFCPVCFVFSSWIQVKNTKVKWWEEAEEFGEPKAILTIIQNHHGEVDNVILLNVKSHRIFEQTQAFTSLLSQNYAFATENGNHYMLSPVSLNNNIFWHHKKQLIGLDLVFLVTKSNLISPKQVFSHIRTRDRQIM